MKIFIAHSSGMYKQALEYEEEIGIPCYIPIRDTDQSGPEVKILKQNLEGMKPCDEVHVIWDLSSLGTIFDIGMAYALGKPIKIVKTKTHHWTKFIAKEEGKYLIGSKKLECIHCGASAIAYLISPQNVIWDDEPLCNNCLSTQLYDYNTGESYDQDWCYIRDVEELLLLGCHTLFSEKEVKESAN